MGLLLVQMYFWLTSLKRFKKLLRYSSPSPAFPQIWPPLPIRKLGAVMKTKRKKKQFLPSTAHTSGAHPPNRALFAPRTIHAHRTTQVDPMFAFYLSTLHRIHGSSELEHGVWPFSVSISFLLYFCLFLWIPRSHANESLLSRSTSTAEYFR